MSVRPRDIVLLAEAGPVADAIAGALAERGHAVDLVLDPAQLAHRPRPDVLVVDLGHRGPRALDPVQGLGRPGHPPRVVVLSAQRDVDECRRALRLGAADYLAKPFPIDEFLRAVEDGTPEDGAPEAESRAAGRFRRGFPATAGAIDRASREVAAYGLRCALSPTARSRVATSCAELVENVVRHAYPADAGRVEIELAVSPRQLALVVRDEGVGFDAVGLGLEHMTDARDGGLARVSALCEDLRLESGPAGTTAHASFDVYRVRFDGEEGLDLSEHDWLAPETTRGLLDHLAGPDDERESLHLSPALAVTVGRLLAGPDPRRVLQTALWS